VRDPRRKIQDGERGGVGMGVLDSDAGSHPVAAGRCACPRADARPSGAVGISLRSYK
jgi:hypothetical protein